MSRAIDRYTVPNPPAPDRTRARLVVLSVFAAALGVGLAYELLQFVPL